MKRDNMIIRNLKSGLLLLMAAYVISFQACTPHEYIDPELSPVHTVSIVNNSSAEFMTEISTFSRVDGLDYNYFDKGSYQNIRLDSTFKVIPDMTVQLFQDLLVDDKGQLKIREIANRITKFRVYKIVNSDTLEATIDLEDFNVWSYSNNNAVFPEDQEHYYKLTIEDRHFD